jgi:hypothetical protein
MKIKVEFEKGDLNSLHDTIIDLSGKSLSHEELVIIWNKLPKHLKDDSIRWGVDDSVVRDNIYVYLRDND